MTSRREFLQALGVTAALMPGHSLRAFAQQRLTQDQLLRLGPPVGNVTLVHLTDMHAQLKPLISASRRSTSASARHAGNCRMSPARRCSMHFKIPPGSAPPMR